MQICGACKEQFEKKEDYLGHTCNNTGFKPTNVKHLDKLSNGAFSKQSAKAIERGELRKKAK